jgi:hypothetical protein
MAVRFGSRNADVSVRAALQTTMTGTQRKRRLMKQKALSLGLLVILLIGACAPQAVPTVDPLDVQHTAEAAAFTMVAQTRTNPRQTPCSSRH